jgi:hypothetical protein
MIRRRLLSFVVTVPFLVMPAASFGDNPEVPASCPVTLPSSPAFIPPDPYPQNPPGRGIFWHGTAGLWTMLRPDGTIGTADKQFWWSPGFHPMGMGEPPLKIEGRRLDREAPPLVQPWVTNAHAPEFGGWTMLIGLAFPTYGCWKVTASYGSDHVTFVVWVTKPFGAAN